MNSGLKLLSYRGNIYFANKNTAKDLLYAYVVLDEDVSDRAILAWLKTDCEVWNDKIKNLNINQQYVLLSAN